MGQRLRGERETGEAHLVDLAVRAHLEAARGRVARERGRVPGGAIDRGAEAVEAPRHVRVAERSDQALGDAHALQGEERRVPGQRFQAVAILEASDGRREAAPPERQARLLQEGLALVAIVGVREVRRPRPEVAEWRVQARIVRQVRKARVLHLEDEIGVRKERAQTGAQLTPEERIVMRARGRRAVRRTEEVDDLPTRPFARREGDVLPPIGARQRDIAREDQNDEEEAPPVHTEASGVSNGSGGVARGERGRVDRRPTGTPSSAPCRGTCGATAPGRRRSGSRES